MHSPNPFMRGLAASAILTILLSACSSVSVPAPQRPEAARPAPAQTAPAKTPGALAVGVNDGDTITVRMIDTGRQERVRLATIDAPELNQPFGQASKKSLSKIVFGKEVNIDEIDRDRYGRIVAEVWVNGLNVNLEQIRMGYAWHYREFQRQQTPEQRRAYAVAEESARSGRFGLWRDKDPVAPWEWRKEK